MKIDYVEIGCFRCTHESLVEWIRSRCEVHIEDKTWYIPAETDTTALFKINGIELVNDKVTRLLFIKMCRGYYVCDGLRSSMPAYLKRKRKDIAYKGAKRVIESDLDGDAYRFALTIEPMKDNDA